MVVYTRRWSHKISSFLPCRQAMLQTEYSQNTSSFGLLKTIYDHQPSTSQSVVKNVNEPVPLRSRFPKVIVARGRRRFTRNVQVITAARIKQVRAGNELATARRTSRLLVNVLFTNCGVSIWMLTRLESFPMKCPIL